MSVRSLSLLWMIGLAAGGCRKLDPVPEGADGAAAWLYRYQDSEAEDEVALAMAQLGDALALADLEDAMEGLMQPLDADAVAAVGRTAVESLPEADRAEVTDEDLDAGTYVRLADQQGMVVASIIPCTVEDTVEVFVRLDQDVIHGGYEAYERQYTSDRDAFDADTPVSWQTDYTVSLLGATYDATILGQMRWVAGDEPLAIARAYLPEPGVFTSGGRYFRQDYQLDLFYPTRRGNDTIHVFVVWRDMNLAGFHSSNAAYIATVSDAFRKGDEEIGAVCNPE